MMLMEKPLFVKKTSNLKNCQKYISYLFLLSFGAESRDGRGLEDGRIAGRDVGDADVRLEGHHVGAT